MTETRTATYSLPDLAGIRVGFLVIGRKRPGFDAEWHQIIETAAWKALQSISSMPARPETRVVDHATLQEALQQIQNARCDALVVLQPTMGDGRLAPIIAQAWNAPLVLWATPERPDGNKVSACSLVATHAFASLFRQLDRPFELAYGHPDHHTTRQQLGRAIRLTYAARALRRAKIGLVGAHAPGFINMQVDAAALNRDLGAQLHHFGLHEFIDLVRSQHQQLVLKDLQAVNALELPMEDGISADDLAVNSRYYLAMRSLMDQEHVDALAVRCWPELPNLIGHWPYLAMARLAEDGRVVAMEGDADGALTCLIGKWLGLGVGYISDWLEHDAEAITLWHAGNTMDHLCERRSVRLGRHFNNDRPLVVNARLKPDLPVTLVRVWRCDGRYRITAHHGQTAPVRRELLGAHGLVVLENRNPAEYFDTLCHQGMPHHVIVFQGHHAQLLTSFARQLRLPFVP